MNKGELNRILKGHGTFTPEESTKIRSILKEIIAQNDYIVFDVKDVNWNDATGESYKWLTDAIRNIYLANPLSALSIVFKDYRPFEAPEGVKTLIPVTMVDEYDGEVMLHFGFEDNPQFSFTI